MDSILLEKESMMANYGDSRVENSFSGSSFASFESGSSTPKTCAEDSGIDDRSASLEKVRLEIGKDGLCKTDGTLKVSSPPGAGVLSLDSQGVEKKSLTSSFNDQDEGELCLEDIENETESALKRAPSDQQLFESPDRSTNTSQGCSNESASDNHSSVERSFVNSNSAGGSGAETKSQDNSETCSNQNSSENYSSELTSVESSGISKIQSDNSDLKDTGSSGNSSEVYLGHSTNESLPSAELSLAESQNQAESNGMPQTPPDGCDLNLEGLTSTPNLVTRVEHTDLVSPHQPVCEGSFVGKARHKDGSLLGIIFQVLIYKMSFQGDSSLWVN